MSEQQAFPTPAHEGDSTYSRPVPGMTMRQYYKAAAMRGLLANPSMTGNHADTAELVKQYAKLADAMLAEDAAHATPTAGEAKQEKP